MTMYDVLADEFGAENVNAVRAGDRYADEGVDYDTEEHCIVLYGLDYDVFHLKDGKYYVCDNDHVYGTVDEVIACIRDLEN